MNVAEIKSPCILVCQIEAKSGYCLGCGRSRDEIGRWILLSDAERDAVMALLPARLDRLGMPELRELARRVYAERRRRQQRR